MRLTQAIWRTGKIPQQLLWIIVVLLPKGGGEYRGIGLLESIWKVLEVVMDRRLNVIKLHNCLHGFRSSGTAAIEAKLATQMTFM